MYSSRTYHVIVEGWDNHNIVLKCKKQVRIQPAQITRHPNVAYALFDATLAKSYFPSDEVVSRSKLCTHSGMKGP